MAVTDDYKQSAPLYQEVFDDQNRAETPSVIDTGQQFDRDNLLYFIEDKFKSNVRGGISIFNLRALFHTMVKSFSNVKDDSLLDACLVHVSSRMFSYGSTRYYFGSTSLGWVTNSWSSYVTSLNVFRKDYQNSGYLTAFPVKGISAAGMIKPTSSVPETMEVTLGYVEPDDFVSSPNNNAVTVLGSTTVDTTVLNDVYRYEITTSNATVPAGKIILVFFRVTTHDGVGSRGFNITVSLNHKI